MDFAILGARIVQVSLCLSHHTFCHSIDRMCLSYPDSLEERLLDLGNIPLTRILNHPAPGQATTEDWLVVREKSQKLYELVDGTLVEKPMGWLESLLGTTLGRWLGNYVSENNLGLVTGADGFTMLFEGTVRGPDVAFVSWAMLPDGRLPTEPLPKLVPNFVVEILSQGNTYGEMSRKRREYFQAGVELLWMVDRRDRTITAYESSQRYRIIREDEMIDAAPVLPGWSFNTADLFSILDQLPPQ